MKRILICILLFVLGGVAAPQKGSMKDSRDGQTYKTVKIGEQTWMAENLKVEMEDSWCYEENESNCKKYGRLYTWKAAIMACPVGWRLPSKEDFETLFSSVAGKVDAGKALKSKKGWAEGGNGSDVFSFSALPAGFRDNGGYFGYEGLSTYFWSSTGKSGHGADIAYLLFDSDGTFLDNYGENHGLSVRCLKDDSPQVELKDTDGNTYKTVKIGGQTWMAENLKVKTEDSWCYADKETNCKKYGRLYTWKAAMKACPAGWHLPSNEELEMLFEGVGGEPMAAMTLKSKSGWKGKGNGTDDYKFTALPAGYRGQNGRCGDIGYHTYFWSTTEENDEDAYSVYIDYDNSFTYLYTNGKTTGCSVRCLKD